MLSTRHIAGLSNERVNGACNFPKPLKSRAIDEKRRRTEKIGKTNIRMEPGMGVGVGVGDGDRREIKLNNF